VYSLSYKPELRDQVRIEGEENYLQHNYWTGKRMWDAQVKFREFLVSKRVGHQEHYGDDGTQKKIPTCQSGIKDGSFSLYRH